MIDLKGFSKLTKDELRFIDAYSTKICYYREAIRYYKEYVKLKDIEDSKTIIRNTHLWVTAFIDKYPDLIEFKEEIESKMEELKIDKWPDYVYEDNHYKEETK